MSVDHPELIDMINQSRTTNAISLVISDHLPWDDVGTHAAVLQKKIQRYLLFIKNGEILKLHPHSASDKKIIEVYFLVDPPPGSATKFLQDMKRFVNLAGVGFRYQLFDGTI